MEQVTRRSALGLGVGVLATIALASCAQPTPTSSSASSSGFKIPGGDVKATVPESVALKWIDTGAITAGFVPELVAAYQSKRPNAHVTYESLAAPDMTQLLQLSFQNGTLPDIFRIVAGVITPAEAVRQGLVHPLDDIVPDFDKWKASFPAGHFIEGLNVFNGKTYTFPMLGEYTLMLLFNRKYLHDAGYDFEKTPPTFDTFRQAAKKITKAGKGKYYGMVLGGALPSRWQVTLDLLASFDGAIGGPFNYRTGEYNYTSDGYANAVELILAMRDDKSFDPGTTSMAIDVAQSKIPTGRAGMMINETGVLPAWFSQYPKFDLGVAHPPVGSSGKKAYFWSNPQNAYYFVSAKTKAADVIGDLFTIMGSQAGQAEAQRIGGGALPLTFPKANQIDSIDSRLRAANTFYPEVVRLLPQPQVRNPDAAAVVSGMRPLTPDFGSTMQGIFSGQISDPKAALRDLQSRANAELDRAIAAAQKAGAKVSRDDWVFSDWNPSESYVSK